MRNVEKIAVRICDLLCVEIPVVNRVEKRLKVGGEKAWWRGLETWR
jgi:hypothetical protein